MPHARWLQLGRENVVSSDPPPTFFDSLAAKNALFDLTHAAARASAGFVCPPPFALCTPPNPSLLTCFTPPHPVYITGELPGQYRAHAAQVGRGPGRAGRVPRRPHRPADLSLRDGPVGLEGGLSTHCHRRHPPPLSSIGSPSTLPFVSTSLMSTLALLLFRDVLRLHCCCSTPRGKPLCTPHPISRRAFLLAQVRGESNMVLAADPGAHARGGGGRRGGRG